MAAVSPSKLKESIRQSFRKACLRRLEGQEAEAVKILQEELPALIKEWQAMDDCQPAEIEALLAEELARTESDHWIVKEVQMRSEKGLEAALTMWNAKLQLELNTLKSQVESRLGEVKSQVDSRLGEMITYSGAEALGGRVAQELSERVRGAITEITLRKHDLESALWQAQGAIVERLEGPLKNLLAQAEQGTQTQGLMLSEVKTTLEAQLQKLVSAEAFEARLMAATHMLHEAQAKGLQEAVALLQDELERRLNETVGPLNQRVSSLITFQDWERVNRETQQKMLIQFEGLQQQGMGILSNQQQNFLTGLQRDWELLHKNLEELKRRQVALEGDLRGVAVVVDDFRQELAKTKESISSVLTQMTDQLKAFDEANRQLKLTIPQALQNFERQTDNRLRDQAQLYQAEINALHRKLEAGLTEAFGKKLKNLKVVAE